MVLRGHRETLVDTGLVVVLIVMFVLQAITPSAGVKAADASSAWHLTDRRFPLIVSGRMMLLVRFVAEQLGADVQWKASTKAITIAGPGQ
jgi:hypothetical protein